MVRDFKPPTTSTIKSAWRTYAAKHPISLRAFVRAIAAGKLIEQSVLCEVAKEWMSGKGMRGL